MSVDPVVGTVAAAARALGPTGPGDSSQHTSAGRISVATWPGGAEGGGHGVGGVRATSSGVGRSTPRTSRAPGDGVDVGLRAGRRTGVVGGVVADDVDHRRVGPAGVVQVGQAVAEAGAEVQQHRGRAAGHAGVAVGRAGGDALEQGEHAAHLRHVVERGDEVHLRGAGVHEADVDPGVDEGADQGLCAVHGCLAWMGRWTGGSVRRVGRGSGQSKTVPGFMMPLGSNAALMRRMSASLVGSSSVQEVVASWLADAVLGRRWRRRGPCRRRTARAAAGAARRVVGAEHAEVHVAVAGVAAPGDPRAVVLGGERLHPVHEHGDLGAGDDDVDDVVGAVGLGHPERLLPGVDQLLGRGRGQHVDVERPELGELGAEGLDVVVEAVLVGVLEHDHQVGQRGVLDLLGDAELEAAVRWRWPPS